MYMNNENKIETYDVVIVGGGASGTALLYTLARYTNIPNIAILEKYTEFGQVNSKGNNNSQTLHIGDIETNYSLEKASIVKPAALMVPRYVEKLSDAQNIVFPVQKMILAVGAEEVAVLEKRYLEFQALYPDLEKLDFDGIAEVEPEVVRGRDRTEPILALFTLNGHAVDYEALSQSFVKDVKQMNANRAGQIDILPGHGVEKIEKTEEGYLITTAQKVLKARAVVVDTDSYSLLFAKSLGYGSEFSLIPVAGNFYFSKEVLRGKVYTMQEKKLPFAAVHGDPDVQVPDVTRWGPTAKFFPVLESGRLHTMIDYFRSAGLLRFATVKSFVKILLDPIRFIFLLKNASYDFPVIGKYLFLHNVQKIVPSMRAKDLRKATGFGGMRLQRVDTSTHELQLGEGKIIGDNIIFNMTPSPGASVCLFNGMRDAEQIVKFFDGKYHFLKCDMETDFGDGCFDHDGEQVSENMYVS